ncbi:MAG: glycosyltransferase family 2 protein [Ignavibacteriales bacterium]|nr:glycosyltransferase family 2 protein [Ignavibacteriales bacterium]
MSSSPQSVIRRSGTPSRQRNRVPLVVAVVLNYNGWHDTVRCVRSLEESGYKRLDIVVVDNGSTDDSLRQLRRRLRGISILSLAQNGGYAAGNNAGIRQALEMGAEYVLVMNNDVVVEKKFLQPMIKAAERDPMTGIVTCKVLYASSPHEVFSGAGRFSWSRCTGVSNGLLLLRPDNNNEECPVDFACGVLFLAKRNVFESVGFLDERYFMYFEDVEFSRRVSRQFKMMYTPYGVAYHKSGGGKGWKTYTELYLFYHTRNRFWAFAGDPFLYRAYVVVFTLMNSAAKAAIILMNYFREPETNRKRLLVLAKGIVEGLSGIPHQRRHQ